MDASRKRAACRLDCGGIIGRRKEVGLLTCGRSNLRIELLREDVGTNEHPKFFVELSGFVG